jgi:hypothetical protein
MIGIFFTRKYCILYIVDSDFFLDSIMDLHINMNECMYTSIVGVGWPVLAGRQTEFSDSLFIFFDWKYVDVFSADIVSIFSARWVIVGCTSVKIYSVAYQMIFKIKKHRFFLPKKTSIQWHAVILKIYLYFPLISTKKKNFTIFNFISLVAYKLNLKFSLKNFLLSKMIFFKTVIFKILSTTKFLAFQE